MKLQFKRAHHVLAKLIGGGGGGGREQRQCHVQSHKAFKYWKYKGQKLPEKNKSHIKALQNITEVFCIFIETQNTTS